MGKAKRKSEASQPELPMNDAGAKQAAQEPTGAAVPAVPSTGNGDDKGKSKSGDKGHSEIVAEQVPDNLAHAHRLRRRDGCRLGQGEV